MQTALSRDDGGRWPPLPYGDWTLTKETLHRYVQVIGKVRRALVPFRNHWWHVTLYVTSRGLSTGAMPTGDGRQVEIAFDFIDHRLALTGTDGGGNSFALRDGLACAEFYDRVATALAKAHTPVTINPAPYDLPGPDLSQDHGHSTYDADAVGRLWATLRASNDVLGEFSGWFNGKQSPVHLFWHSFDLAHARYSGLRAPVREGAGLVEAEAYSHEVIAFGFWPGDDKVPYPAYYSYTAPAPDGLAAQPLEPAGASWDADAGTAILAYDDVRESEDPRGTLLRFLESAYRAGATSAGWDLADLATRVAPSPDSGISTVGSTR